MKVKDLIEALQKLDGDLEVYGLCDHGQTPEQICKPTVVYVPEVLHTLWDGYYTYPEDSDDAVKKVVIL